MRKTLLTLMMMVGVWAWGADVTVRLLPSLYKTNQVCLPGGLFFPLEVVNRDTDEAEIQVILMTEQWGIPVGNNAQTSVADRVAPGETKRLAVYMPVLLDAFLHSPYLNAQGSYQYSASPLTCQLTVCINGRSEKIELEDNNRFAYEPGFNHVARTEVLPRLTNVNIGLSAAVEETLQRVCAVPRDTCVLLNSVSCWPADFRVYRGLTAIWMMEKEWEAMTENVRQALVQYERLGGTVVVIGTAGKAGLDMKHGKARREGLGRHFQLADIRCVESILPHRPDVPQDYSSQLSQDMKSWNLDGVFPSFIGQELQHQALNVPLPNIMPYMIVTLVMILVLGPITFWVLVVMKKRLLPFLVTPAMAIVGSLLFIIGNYWVNRAESRMRIIGIMTLDQQTGAYAAQAAVSRLQKSWPADGLVLNSQTGIDLYGSKFALAYDGQLQRVTKWPENAAVPIQYAIQQAGTTNVRLEVKADENGCRVTNHFGCDLGKIVVVGRDRRVYSAAAVPAGKTVELKPADGTIQAFISNVLPVSTSMLNVLKDTGDGALHYMAAAGLLQPGEYAAMSSGALWLDVGWKADSTDSRVMIIGRTEP